MALAVPLWSAVPAAQASPGAGGPTAAPAAEPSPSESTPSELARRTGKPVEVTAKRTETTRIFANPNGTMSLEQYALPVRVRKGERWVPVDTTLTRDLDGTVRPTAAVADIRLAGGAGGPLVTLRRAAHHGAPAEVRLGWPGRLPQPVLDGDTATYPEVMQGVDLRVTVEADGFSQVLVIKNREAAANPALRRLRYPIGGSGVSLNTTATGTTVASDAKGRKVFVAGTPAMWSADGTPTHLPASMSRGALEIVPDQAMLTSPQTRYPVYVDPSFAGYKYRWTHVNRAYPDQSYWNYDRGEGAKVGYSNWSSPTVTYRSFFQMDLKPINGAIVHGAYFAITLDHSASCTATPVDLWHTKPIDPAVPLTWRNTTSVGFWLTKLDTRSGSANESSCPKPDQGMEFVSSGLTSRTQQSATNRTGYLTLGLKAPDEGANTQWKRFHPNTARMVVEYNNAPVAPFQLNLNGRHQCGTASAPTVTNDAQPRFSAIASDPDRQNLTTTLSIRDAAGTVVHSASASTTSGAAFSWPEVPAGTLVGGTVYRYSAASSDGVDAGSASAACYFTLDTVRPGVPTITSTDFPDGEPVLDSGVTGTVTLRPAAGDTDVTEYVYGFERERMTLRVKAAPDGTATIPITVWPDPMLGIPSAWLYVRAVDAAGNAGGISPGWDLQAWDNPNPPPRAEKDANGDGRPDITTVIDHGNGRTAVWNVTASNSGFHKGYAAWDSGNGGGFPLYRTRAVTGDFDGDGRNDTALLREEAGRTISLYVLRSDGNRYHTVNTPAWVSGSWAWSLGVARVLSGDVNGDGKTDIVVQRDTDNSSWQAMVFLGGNLGAPTTWLQLASGSQTWQSTNPVLADMDGDGRADLVTQRDMGGCRTLTEFYRSSGTSFATTPETLRDSGAGNWCANRTKLTSGDVTGDGRDELIAMYDYGNSDVGWWALRYGAPAYELWQRTQGEFDPIRVSLVTGDYDLDGRADLGAVYAEPAGSRQVWTLRSTGTGFAARVLAWQDAVGSAGGPSFDLEHRAYELVSRDSKRCLQIAGASTTDQALAQQYTCGNGLHQRFLMAKVADTDRFTLRAVHSNRCLTVDGSKLDDNAALYQLGCAAVAANQQITLEYVDGTGYDTVVRVHFAHSDKCAGHAPGNLANSAAIVQQSCTSGSHQEWILRAAYNNTQLDGRFKVAVATNSMVLDVTDCRTADGSDVRFWDYISASPCQKWTVKPLGDDVYEIIDGNSGKLLNVAGCSTASLAPVDLFQRYEGGCQQWRIEPTASGRYSIFSVHSGMAMRLYSCTTSGRDTVVTPYTGSSCYRYTFTTV